MLLPGKGRKRPVGALGLIRSGLDFRVLPPGLVAELSEQLGVRHAGACRRYPAVYWRRAGSELGFSPVRYLDGRESPSRVGADQGYRGLEVVLLDVDPRNP